MKEFRNVYAPVFHLGKREVWTIPVKKVRVACNGKLVFINGQHYNDVYATREEAENYWTRNGYCKPLTANEILALVKED